MDQHWSCRAVGRSRAYRNDVPVVEHQSVFTRWPGNSALGHIRDQADSCCTLHHTSGHCLRAGRSASRKATFTRPSSTCGRAPGAIAGYTYTIDAAGHRTGVTAFRPHGQLHYEAVGNRKQISSTLAPVPAGLFNYDANDRFTAGDTYDNDGNTVSSGGIANTYDFENHLIQNGGVTIVYDGDGNRVSKTVAGVTTTYLVDTLNPTGYAQVVSETFSGSSAPNRELSHIYV